MAGRMECAGTVEAALLDMTADSVVRAAGGIVMRREHDHVLIAVVHRPRYDDWSFPKGKLENGEGEETAALREVLEETGLRCRLERHVGAVTYVDRRDRPKVVRYWTMTPESGAFVPGDEVDELRWLRPTEAIALLSYDHDRDLMRSAIGAQRPPVYVIRHAKAGDRTSWVGDDAERPLTKRGRRQAERLVERFRGLEVARIVSSPYVRCVQTVEPLARSRGLAVERSDALAEAAEGGDAVRALIEGLGDPPVVLSMHRGEIETLIDGLAARGTSIEGRGGIAKGSVWILDRGDARITSARYLPPLGP